MLIGIEDNQKLETGELVTGETEGTETGNQVANPLIVVIGREEVFYQFLHQVMEVPIRRLPRTACARLQHIGLVQIKAHNRTA